MSTISNKFFVQVLEDGKQLHGQLLANPTPSQAYRDGEFVPDWSDATQGNTRPIVYLSMLNGSDPVVPSSFTWYYNGTEITFGTTSETVYIGNTQYTGYKSTDNKFFKTTYTVGTVAMPALGIIGNLASSTNVDIDVIRLDGEVTLSTNPVNFSASINVTITQWTTGGKLGILSFPSGSIIDENHQSISVEGILYGEQGEITSGVTYNWYYEGQSGSSPWKTGKTITIAANEVVDYLVIRCEFVMVYEGTNTVVATAYGSIDDQQDPEYMWIKYNGATGNTASLRSGESVTFSVCVGTVEDDTPKAAWTSFKVKLLDSEGNTITDYTTSTHNDSVFHTQPDADGYRALSVSSGTATAKVYYDEVLSSTLAKKGLTGVVIASTT